MWHLCLVYLSTLFQAHPRRSMNQHFNPLQGPLIFCVGMCHIWCTHSSAGRHLGYSYHLTTVNNAATNTFIQASVWMYVFTSLGYILGAELLGPTGVLFNR